MSNALSAVLQGLERGAGMGMEYYRTMQSEARANRQEARALVNDMRRNMESDRAFEYSQERDRAADDRWERNFVRQGEQFDKSHAISERQVGVSEGQLSLSRNRFAYEQSENERVRREQNATQLFASSLLDEGGQYITDNKVFAQRMNNNPQALRSMLEVAAARGLIDPARIQGYTGGQLIATPNGLVLRVAGVDATGKPIKAGGAPLTANGTSDPDDPVMEINLGQLRTMVDPNYRGAQRSAAVRDMQIADIETGTAATLADAEGQYSERLAGIQQDMKALAAEYEALAAQRAWRAGRPLGGGRPGEATRRKVLDKMDKQLEAKQAEMEQAARTFGAYQQDSFAARDRISLGGAYQQEAVRRNAALQGENYATLAAANQVAGPEMQLERNRQMDKDFNSFTDNIVSSAVQKLNSKNEIVGPYKLTRSELEVVRSMIPQEFKERAIRDPSTRVAIQRALELASRHGFMGNPMFLLDVDRSGGNMDAYMEYINSPSTKAMSDKDRHAAGVEVARQSSADPSRSVSTLAGQLRLP